jgi:DNA-binding ferritin-like protein
VKGFDFYRFHKLFDEMAGELEAFIDTIAERVTALGGSLWALPGLPPRYLVCQSIL